MQWVLPVIKYMGFAKVSETVEIMCSRQNGLVNIIAWKTATCYFLRIVGYTQTANTISQRFLFKIHN